MMIPTRKGYFVKAEDGFNLRISLCGNIYRAQQIIADYLLRLDPFQNSKRTESLSKLELDFPID